MFNSRGKQHVKAVNTTSSAVDCGDTEEHLSHNSRREQSKIDAQAAEIATVKTELNKALEENKKIQKLVQSRKDGWGHVKSGQCHDHTGSPKNIQGHSVSRSLKLCRQAEAASTGT